MSRYQRITNVTDQLKGFTEEAYAEVERLKKEHSLTTNQAIKMVEIGINNIMCDAYWRELCTKEDFLEDTLEDTLVNISNSFEEISSSLANICDSLQNAQCKNTDNR